MLREAVELAARGRGSVRPNPMVGAVVARGTQVIGRGHHRRAGGAHAEILALRRAGAGARGATLYVNLEPCAHHGRTPPCVDAILAAGIRRVVASMVDPDPRVHGRGFAALRRAGVQVLRGLLQAEARLLNEAYLTYVRHGRPFVLLKGGMSLDGRIATRTGASRWITSGRSRREARGLRWEHDAILVGVGTILADDPELLALRRSRPKPDLLRVVVDSGLRTPPTGRLARTTRCSPVLIYTTRGAPAARERRLQAAGVEIHRVASRGGRVDLQAVLADLGRRQILSVMVEGGGEVHASFLDAGLADKVRLYIAPILLGGVAARPVVGGEGVALPAAAPRLQRVSTRMLGEDLVIEGYPVR